MMLDKKPNRYPLFILLLLGSFLLFLAWSGKQASTRGSDITDRDYYSKGLKYNTTLVEKRAASVLGWSMHSRLEKSLLQVRLDDSKKQPVAGAIGTLLLYGAGDAKTRRLSFREGDSGKYLLELPTELQGELRASLEFERAGARLNRQLLLNL